MRDALWYWLAMLALVLLIVLMGLRLWESGTARNWAPDAGDAQRTYLF